MTSSMPWVKIYTEMLDDPKVGRLPDALKWRFIQLILLAGELDEEGLLPASLDDAAWRLRLDVETLQADLTMLAESGLAHIDEATGRWCITKFAERQGRPQSEKREQWREYQQRHRDKSEDVINDTSVTPAPREEERREDIDKDKEEEKNDSRAGGLAPAANPLTAGQTYFLEALGAKRFKNHTQRSDILELEQTYGIDKLREAIHWAATRGLGLGAAVAALKSALPKWGQPKDRRNGKGGDDVDKYRKDKDKYGYGI